MRGTDFEEKEETKKFEELKKTYEGGKGFSIMEKASLSGDMKKLIVLDCSECGKNILEAFGDWEEWSVKYPVFCLECYRNALLTSAKRRREG